VKVRGSDEGQTRGGRVSLEAVALLEFCKGLIVLLAGIGVSAYASPMWSDTIQAMAEHMRLVPSRHLPRIILNALEHPERPRLVMMACLAFAYSAVRFVEAYGLWRHRLWAEWFGAATAVAYVPFEIVYLIRKPGMVSVLFLSVNLLIIGVLTWMLRRDLNQRAGR
jgi:uncharacterized membrane protein (DUF2068 family)